MNKKGIIGHLFDNSRNIGETKKTEKKTVSYAKERKIKILQDIEEAKLQWESAAACFQFVKEEKLIECAIYTEAAAKARYMYLLLEAKRMGIKVEVQNTFQKVIEA